MTIRDLFLIFIAVWLIAAVFAIIKMVRTHRSRTGRGFPPKESEEILYEERSTSGRSMRSFFTRLGGARKCLRFVVGNEKFWVTVIAPFNLIGNQFDLEHEIPYSEITNLEKKGDKLKLEYRSIDGETRQLELFPNSTTELHAYLKGLTSNKAGEAIGNRPSATHTDISL